MADNVTYQTATLATPPNATVVSTEEITTLNGAGVAAQQVQRLVPCFRTADGVAVDHPGDGTRGQDVNVTDSATRDNGKVDIANIDSALPAGANNIGVVNARVRNQADAAYIEPSTLGEQQTQTTSLQLIDDIVHANDVALSKVAAIGGQFDDTAPGTTTEDRIRALRMSTRRELYIQIRDAGGNERGINVDANGEIGIGAIRTSVTPGTAAANLGKAEDAVHGSGDTGVMALAVANEANTVFAADADYVPIGTDREGANRNIGNRAHDAVDAGAPLKIGGRAIAHGANPTAVAAADRTDLYANRHGIPFAIGGHPNIITREITVLDSDNAQTNAAAITVSAGTKIVVTRCSAVANAANTVNVACRVGFGTASVPAQALAGVNGVVLAHGKIAPGSGVVEGNGSGIIGIGGDDEDLRFTCDDPVGGDLRILISYFTIES